MSEQIIDKITKLLAKAESTDSQPEAEAFSAKAQALMTAHAIEVTMLRARNKTTNERPVEVKIPLRSTWAQQDWCLLTVVAEANYCENYRQKFTGGYQHVVLIGFLEDVQNTQMLYGSLLIQLDQFTRGIYSTEWGVSDNQFRRAFRYGFAAGIQDRLAQARNQSVAEAAEHEPSLLPVLLSKEEQVRAQLPPDLRQARKSSLGSRDGGRAGYAAAGRANVGGPALGTQRGLPA